MSWSLQPERQEEVSSLCLGELGVWSHFPPCATVRNASVQQSSEFPLVIAAKSIAEMISRWFFPPVSCLFVHCPKDALIIISVVI